MTEQPTTEKLLDQLRATRVGRPPLEDTSACTVAAATAWFDRIQSQRRDDARRRPDGRPWQWEDLTDSDQAAYIALVGPIVDAVLTTLQQPGTVG